MAEDDRFSELEEKIDNTKVDLDTLNDEVVSDRQNTSLKQMWGYPEYGVWLSSGGGKGFNGICYDRAGNKTVLLNLPGQLWVRYNQSSGAFSEHVGPPSEPWGADELWRKKSDIPGTLYLQ